LSPHATTEDVQQHYKAFPRPDSMFAEDGDWSTDDEETEIKETSMQKHSRMSSLPVDSDEASEIDYVELRLDQQHPSTVAGIATETPLSPEAHLSIEQQVMPLPTQLKSNKKLRGLRKACSKVKKACLAAFTTLICCGKNDQ
jgi:hypothetical protein